MDDGIGRGHVAVVVGNPKRSSRTSTVAEAVGARLRDGLGGRTSCMTIELADLASELFTPGSDRCREAEEIVTKADAIVVASPVYKATYTGLLKAFLDRLPTGVLAGTPCAAVMLGGSLAHSLAVELHLRPLLTELGGHTLPGCYVTEQALDRLTEEIDAWWLRARICFPPNPANHGMKEMTDVGSQPR
jgi:FMN reductase